MKKSNISKLLAITVLASLAVSACGGSTSETGTAEETTTASAETTGTSAEKTGASAEGTTGSGDVRTIVVSHSTASWPYNALTADGESDGFEVAVLKAIDELLPQYEFKFEPTGDDSDLLIGVQTGKYQIGSKGAWWTKDRADKYLFPEHYIAASVTGLVFRTENADQIKDMQSLADFSGLLVPLAPQNAQYTIIENYNKKNPDHQVILEAADNFTVSEQYQWVIEGRYDAAFVIQEAPMIQSLPLKMANITIMQISFPMFLMRQFRLTRFLLREKTSLQPHTTRPGKNFMKTVPWMSCRKSTLAIMSMI